MKKLLLVAFLAFLAFPKANAQENVIKFNPLALIVGEIQVGYERVLSENQSLQVDLAYASFNSGVFDYTGFGGGLQYRFYVQKEKSAPVGWFAGPFASYSSTKSGDLKASVFAAGGVIGYQWNWNPITLDIYGGPAYYNVDSDDVFFDFGFDGFGPKLGISLGYAF